jgi:glycosyltransferase involved in cell wall biosynthesis
VTAHDIVPVVLPEERAGAAARIATRWTHRRRYAGADHVIAISRQTRDDLVAVLGIAARDISIVHHGVDRRRFHEEAAASEGQRLRRVHRLPERYLLCVSSDHYRKNHRLLLDAWYRVAPEIDLGLVFVGHPLYEDTLTRIAAEIRERGLQARFRWLADVSDDELPAFYRQATACVAPSRYEGFGMTLLEAMACGTPVLAARNGAHEEVGGEAALYFGPEDGAELEVLLRRIARDAELDASLRRRGRERAAAMSWRTTAEKTLDVYRRVATTT